MFAQIVTIIGLLTGAWVFGRVAYEEDNRHISKPFWERVDVWAFKILSFAALLLAISETVHLCR